MLPPLSGGSQLLDPKYILTKAGVAQGMAIADLGCGGAGHFVFPAAPMVGPAGKVYALDILQSVLQPIAQRAREQNLNNIIAVWSDLEKFKGAKEIADGALDVAMLINTLFQSKNHEAMMRESARMLKRGGRLLVVEWKMSGAPFGPATAVRVPMDVVRTLARDLHLDEYESFEAGPYHYGLLFKKVA